MCAFVGVFLALSSFFTFDFSNHFFRFILFYLLVSIPGVLGLTFPSLARGGNIGGSSGVPPRPRDSLGDGIHKAKILSAVYL